MDQQPKKGAPTRAPGKNQEKKLILFRQNSSIAAQADFLNLYCLRLTIALLDIRIPALQVENPAPNVRYWQSGMTRSLEFSRIRAPWSHI